MGGNLILAAGSGDLGGDVSVSAGPGGSMMLIAETFYLQLSTIAAVQAAVGLSVFAGPVTASPSVDDGGDMLLEGGDGKYTGGSVSLLAGQSTDAGSSTGGDLILSAGASMSAGGSVTIAGGSSTTATASAGGFVHVQAGSSTADAGGSVSILGGETTAAGSTGGNVLVQAGSSTQHQGGALSLVGGASTGVKGGSLTLAGGTGLTVGDMSVTSSALTVSSSTFSLQVSTTSAAVGGYVELSAGASSLASGSGGALVLSGGGASGASGVGGSVSLLTGMASQTRVAIPRDVSAAAGASNASLLEAAPGDLIISAGVIRALHHGGFVVQPRKFAAVRSGGQGGLDGARAAVAMLYASPRLSPLRAPSH